MGLCCMGFRVKDLCCLGLLGSRDTSKNDHFLGKRTKTNLLLPDFVHAVVFLGVQRYYDIGSLFGLLSFSYSPRFLAHPKP